MRILLLGGYGRLGTALRRLLADRHQISAPQRTALDAQALAAAIGQGEYDLAINAIAYNNVDASEGDGRAEALRTNAELPGVIAAATAAAGVPFLHFSTDYVFAGDKEAGYAEQDEAVAVSAYGESKRLGEIAALAQNPRAYVVRTSRLYGANAESANAKKSFVELIVRDAAASASFLVNGREYSAPTWIDDLVRHLDAHLLSALPAPGIYHMSNAGGATWFMWAQAILHDLHLPNTITPRDPAELNRAARRPEHSVLLTTKIPAMRPWQEALADYLAQDGERLLAHYGLGAHEKSKAAAEKL